MAAESVKPERLTCEYLVDPVGMDVALPRLSWQMASTRRGAIQTAYEVLVARDSMALAEHRGDVWSSGKVVSAQSVHVSYAGEQLASATRYFWKVRTWDADDESSAWSEPALWVTGLFRNDEWAASWIGYHGMPILKNDKGWQQKRSSPVLRRSFDVKKELVSALAFVSGLGYYELRLNGEKVGDHVLDPAFTRYDRRVLYATYDLTGHLRKGENVLGLMLGNGWYNMHTQAVWAFNKAPWRDRPKAIIQVVLAFTDGSTETLVSDKDWRASAGPVVLDGIRQGEVYDARKEMSGWDAPGFDDEAWEPAEVVTAPAGRLRAQMLPPIKVTATLDPVTVRQPVPGIFVFDLGQNTAGWAQLRVKGDSGDRVTLTYGEQLKSDGTVDQKAIARFVELGPFQTDVYILKGGHEEVWEPRFTYHGFRYVQVEGYPGKPGRNAIRGRVVHTAFDRAGSFACSSEQLNRTQGQTLWAYRSNFHGYPTDCPHREKNGWTGDAHLAAEQALYNFHNAAAYLKWLNDIRDEQRDDGAIAAIIPTGGWGYDWGNGPAWDSAYILIPWYLYLYRGDVRVLADHYDTMKRYVDYVASRAKGHIADFGLGDWAPAKTKTPRALTSTGYFHTDAVIVSQAARILGKTEDATRYEALAREIRAAFNQAYYKGSGRYEPETLTALSCALYQGLVEDGEKRQVVDRLAKLLAEGDSKLDTGILGAKYVLNALSENGRHAAAHRAAKQTASPGYGYWVDQDATTLWEHWTGGASRNHVMFGDISAWFYKNLAGLRLDPEQPGFKHVIIYPRPVSGLTWARAEHDSPYGMVKSSWEIREDAMIVKVAIPANASATVHLPVAEAGQVTEGGVAADRSSGVAFVRTDAGRDVYRVGSGNYRFVIPRKFIPLEER